MLIPYVLVFAAAVCQPPKLENKTKFPWNDFDKKTLKGAATRCGQKYPNSPCVKLFRKHGERDYSVICGAK